MFGNPEHAAQFLRTCLPAEVEGRTDWSRLALVSGSFVDEELGQRHCDLLFTAPLAGSDAFFYVLFEHQSTPDPMLVFRMLQYEVRIWERWLREHPEKAKIPAIVPVVLYNGKTQWKDARDFTELIDLEVALKDSLVGLFPRFQFLLDDLTQVGDASLRQRSLGAFVQLTLLSLKHARYDADIFRVLQSSAPLFREVWLAPTGREALNLIVGYIARVSEFIGPQALSEVFTRAIGKSAGESAMTTFGEQLIEKGRQEGRKEGLQEGVQEGRREGREEGVLLGLQQALLRMLRLRFGDVPESFEQRIHSATRQETDQWIGQALKAATLDDLFHS